MNQPTDAGVAPLTINDIADELGITYDSARHWLSRHHIKAIEGGHGRAKALYDPTHVAAARADDTRRAEARESIHRWVRRRL